MKLKIISCAAIALFAWPTLASAADRIAFGSTALQSVHYTYSAAATKAINDKSGDKVQINLIATGGAVDNLERIRRKQINIGLGTYATIFQAYKGIGKFEGKPMANLRGLWVHSPALQAWVVRKDLGITSLDQLNGKSFTPGQRGSATEQLVIQTLDVLGIKPDMYRASLADATSAIKDGRTVGFVKAGGTATLDGTTLELMSLTPISLLSFTDEQVAKVKAALPFVSFQKYANDQVKGFPAFTSPVQVIGEFATSDSLTEAQAIAILEGVVDNQKIQADAFPSFAKIDVMRDSVALIPIPLHAGAVKFYRSRGVEVPAHLVPPEMK